MRDLLVLLLLEISYSPFPSIPKPLYQYLYKHRSDYIINHLYEENPLIVLHNFFENV